MFCPSHSNFSLVKVRHSYKKNIKNTLLCSCIAAYLNLLSKFTNTILCLGKLVVKKTIQVLKNEIFLFSNLSYNCSDSSFGSYATWNYYSKLF